MDSWKRRIPDYEVVLWDTKKFDINSTVWTKQAFELKQYACAADYIRLYAVYHYGGIYLDMDMEALKPFDPLLNGGIMLARENHINENIEAGCFGAEKGHPFIKKCMEFFENRPLADPARLSEALRLPPHDRHGFIDPPIIPEVMGGVLRGYFSREKYPLYSHDYFTAKNVVTGKIEITGGTFTVHHFAARYHSEEWFKERLWKQKVHTAFGENSPLSKIIIGVFAFTQRTKQDGLPAAIGYYWRKYAVKPHR
jgi:hypothetical protein